MTIKKKIYLSAGVLSLLLMLTAIFAYASAFIIGNVSNNILKAYSPALTINSQISTHYSDGRADVRTVTQKYDEALYNEANKSIDAMIVAINDLDKHLKTGKNASIMNVMREYVDKALSLSSQYKQLSDDSMKMRKSIEDLTANFINKANEMERALSNVYTNTLNDMNRDLGVTDDGTIRRRIGRLAKLNEVVYHLMDMKDIFTNISTTGDIALLQEFNKHTKALPALMTEIRNNISAAEDRKVFAVADEAYKELNKAIKQLENQYNEFNTLTNERLNVNNEFTEVVSSMLARNVTNPEDNEAYPEKVRHSAAMRALYDNTGCDADLAEALHAAVLRSRMDRFHNDQPHPCSLKRENRSSSHAKAILCGVMLKQPISPICTLPTRATQSFHGSMEAFRKYSLSYLTPSASKGQLSFSSGNSKSCLEPGHPARKWEISIGS